MPVMIREVVGLAAIVLALAGCASVLSGLDWNAALVVVEVSNGEREQITHTPHGYSGLTWSPDSREVAVVASRPGSSSIEIHGVDGARRTVARGSVGGVAWSPDESTLTYMRASDPDELTGWTIETVALDGSARRQLGAHRSSRIVTWVALAPDGKSVAYTAGPDTFVVPSNGGLPRLLVAGASAPRWSPDGRFVLVARKKGPFRERLIDLVAAPVHGGRPVVVASDLIQAEGTWSPDSERVAFSGVAVSGDRRHHLYVSSPGSEPVRFSVDDVASIAWSPDGSTLAVATWEGEVLLVDPDTGDSSTFTRVRSAHIHDLAWSPDGRRLAFVAQRDPSESFGY